MLPWCNWRPVIAAAAAVMLLATAPAGAQQPTSEQEVQAAVNSEVSWGSANGCVENIKTNDFGSLTPAADAQTLGPFDALPEAEASIDHYGNHVWVGCVTSNTTLASIVAQGIANMKNAAGDTLGTSDVAMGITNQPDGQTPVGCAIVPGQSQAGTCALPSDGSTVRTLVGEVPAGTTELNWQYQLDLPANQPVGNYNGGEIILIATTSESPVSDGSQNSAPANTEAPALSGRQPLQGEPLSASEGQWSGQPTPTYTYQWLRCDSTASDCTAIEGAQAQTYTPTASDLGHTLKAEVTASNSQGQTSKSTAASEPTIAPAPLNTTSPELQMSESREGVPITTTNGFWEYEPASYSYQWEACNSSLGLCSSIPGATHQSYTPTSTDVGRVLRAQVLASSQYGSTTALSSMSAPVLPQPPLQSSPPTLSSKEPLNGVSLSVSNGSWTNSPSKYSYQWEDCNTSGQSCSTIAVATKQTYTPTGADVGHTLKARVTAENAGGSNSGESEASGVVVTLKPLNTVLPIISPTTPQEGSKASTSNGTWSGSPATYTYQWEDCDTSGANCSPIASATSSTYTPVATDVGHKLTVAVSATNANGNETVDSAASKEVLPAAPKNTALPQVTGSAFEEGVPLNASTGTWTGSPTSYTYQWQDCQETENVCGSIGGATAATYTPTSTYVGNYIRVVVTAINAGGEKSATSSSTGKISPPPPVNKTLPTFSSGTPIAGVSLSVTTGSWTNSPTSYAYQWNRCNSSGGGCSAIAAATSSAYTPTSSDVGDTLTVEVTAKNSIGSATAITAPSGVVLQAKPQNTALPQVTASAFEEGVALSASTGTWTGSPTSYTYKWEWCQLGENPCGSIPGATSSTYTPTSTYVGRYIRVVVSAASASGEASATSRAVGKILAAAPLNTAAPILSTGSPVLGVSLSVSSGSWTGSPTSYTYQWDRCNSLGESCTTISGAVNASYTPTSTDLGNTLLALVSASNASGSSIPAASLASAAVGQRPSNTSAPALSTSSPTVGTELSVSTGAWSGYPNLFTYTYQWQACVSGVCGAIAGATSASYTPVASQIGDTLLAAVTATNSAGFTTVNSGASQAITWTSAAYEATVLASKPVLFFPLHDSSKSSVQQLGSDSASNWAWNLSPTFDAPGPMGGSVAQVSGPGSNNGSYMFGTPSTSSISGNFTVEIWADMDGGKGGKLWGTRTAGNSTGGNDASILPTALGTNIGSATQWIFNQTTPYTFATNAWYFLALTVTTSANTVSYEWYVNGQPVGGNSTSTSVVPILNESHNPTYFLGFDGFTGDPPFTGSIAENSVYATALSPATILQHYQAAPIPQNTSVPTLTSSSPEQGVPVTASTGTWQNSPTSFSYTWSRCNSGGGSCSAISGATSASYTPVAADVGQTMEVTVTATNVTGTASASSSPSSVVTS